MSDNEFLAGEFEQHRTHLQSVAYRMLGSRDEAADAVQEAWLRLSRSNGAAIENLGGWLTTVVSRVSLDMLRSRASRREDVAGTGVAERAAADDPEHDVVMADSVGAALLVVLDALTPAERMAFVLHDMFAVPFEVIGAILGRSTNAAKQLATRARGKVQGSDAGTPADPARQRAVVDAFLAASRQGQFDALVALLDPDVVLEADPAAIAMGSPGELRGANAVAGMFSGRAQGAEAAFVDGGVGLVWAVAGRTKVVWDFTVEDGRVTRIEMLAAPETLDALDLVVA